MSAICISQVVAFSRTHSLLLNPRIERTEIVCPQFSDGLFCQVVARTGSTVYGGVFLFSNPLGSYEQSKFSLLVAKLKFARYFPMDVNRENQN